MLLFFNIFTSNFGTNKSNHLLTTLYIHHSFNMPWNDKERCFAKRVRACLQRGGAHLEHILKWRNHSKFDKIFIFCLYLIKCYWLMFMFITKKMCLSCFYELRERKEKRTFLYEARISRPLKKQNLDRFYNSSIDVLKINIFIP